MSTDTAVEPAAAVDQWLSSFDEALTQGDSAAAAELFGEDSFWRDLVAFTWNLKTVEGPTGVKDLLDHTLEQVKPRNWRTSEPPAEAEGVIEAWIDFETEVGRGHGHLRLKDGKAWTLLTTLYELKGHEEPARANRRKGVAHGAEPERETWLEERQREAEELGYTTQPEVVIVGGGQGGIALGARLRQLGVPTIIVERKARPGDSWRNRYKSLCLHDPVWYDHLPYIKFPDNWPVFSPKDKIADWLEMYTRVMELNYWGSTEAKSARYDEDAKEWIVAVERDGTQHTLRPKQLVMATGMSAKPRVPDIPGRDVFKGDQHHSADHPGPDAYAGKRAVVIGSNNSAHDICAALWEQGADVTMVQRTSTHIVRSETLMDIGLGALYSQEAVESGVTTEKADLIFASLALPDHARVPDPAIRPDARARRRLLQAPRGRGLRPRLGRGRLGPLHEVPAPRIGVLHRRRRERAGGRREDQAPKRAGRPSHRGCGGDGGWHRASGRPGGLRHGLQLDERLRGRSRIAGDGGQGRQGLGPRIRYEEGSRSLGGRAAQHVEADPAGGALVPRRQPAPVAPLLAVPGATAEGARGGHRYAGLRAPGGPPPQLTRSRTGL